MKSDLFHDRRGRSRVTLDLPLDYQIEGSRSPYAGIVRNGSETGLLICSRRKIPIGSELDVDVLFADEYELAHFEGRVRVVRTIDPGDGIEGFQHGVEFFRIDEMNYRRFKRLLIGCRDEMVEGKSLLSLDIIEDKSPPTLGILSVNTGERSLSNDTRNPPSMKKLRRFLLKLLEICRLNNVSGRERVVKEMPPEKGGMHG